MGAWKKLYAKTVTPLWTRRRLNSPASPTAYSGTDQRNHQCSASLASVRGFHRWTVNSPYKWPVTRKLLPIGDFIMSDMEGRVNRSFHQVCLAYATLMVFCLHSLCNAIEYKHNNQLGSFKATTTRCIDSVTIDQSYYSIIRNTGLDRYSEYMQTGTEHTLIHSYCIHLPIAGNLDEHMSCIVFRICKHVFKITILS